MRAGLLAALTFAIVAGCLGAEADPAVFRATASKPTSFLGYDYAAADPAAATGTLTIETNAASDTGAVALDVIVDGARYQLAWSRFAESRPFHEGGVRNGFDEHGDTGNGDANLPRFRALSAGWGRAAVTVDGAPFLDPATGGNEWGVHYMVAESAVRDPVSHKVTKADGTTPYDPSAPKDGKTWGGFQALLNVQGASLPDDATETFEATVTGPQHAESYPIAVAAGARFLSVNITIDSALPVTGAGLTFTLVSPDGEAIARAEIGPTSMDASGYLEGDAPAAGNWTLEVTGAGAGTRYEAVAAVDYPSAMFFHLVFDDVRIG